MTRQNIVDSGLSAEPEIGRWLWAFEDTRARTREELDLLTPEVIDWPPPHGDSSIGTVLYHLALIEADWLYAEVLEQEDYAPEAMALFPHAHRDSAGQLTQVYGVSLDEHLGRLAAVRRLVLDVFKPMSLAEFRRVRHLPSYDVTPEWVLHHLMQHEAEHRSQLGTLRMAAERDLGLPASAPSH
jgi:uncharacterized damage-inducible protein DinB